MCLKIDHCHIKIKIIIINNWMFYKEKNLKNNLIDFSF